MATISRAVPQSSSKDGINKAYSLVEVGYYFAVFYATMASALNIAIPLMGAVLLVSLAGFCILLNLLRLVSFYKPLLPVLCCAIVYLFIQVFIHQESVSLGYVRAFVTWIPTLIVTYTLAHRRGFLDRFSIFAFLVGLTLLPYLDFRMAGVGVERARLDADITLANPNALGTWFGFCFVYFTVLGIETRKGWLRFLCWTTAIAALVVVGFTVSRTSLGGGILAAVVAGRRILKKGFVPLLVCVFLGFFILSSGLFEQAWESYAARATEETGRLIVWPAALERFVQTPLVGVGASDVATPIPFRSGPLTPHNSFLFLALSSGIIPVLFFFVYWLQAGLNVLRSTLLRQADAAFLLPLLIYSFLVSNAGNAPYLKSWMIVVMSCCLAAGRLRRGAPSANQRVQKEHRSVPRDMALVRY